MLENLENRRLFAMTSVLASGVLTITGTTGNDSLYVSYMVAGNKINVNDGFTTKPFDGLAVKKIVVIGKEGNDSLWVNSNVGTPASLAGPVTLTDNTTIGGVVVPLSAAGSVVTNVRSVRMPGPPRSVIAWCALLIRLSITCWIWNGSATVCGNSTSI